MSRCRSWTVTLAAVGFVVLTAATPLLAQSISLSPNIGVYIPTSELVRAASGQEFKQEISLLVGGRLGTGFGQRLALTVTGDYSPSELYNASFTGGTATEQVLQHDVHLSFGLGVPLGASGQAPR